MSVQQYLIVVFICTSLVIIAVEHLIGHLHTLFYEVTCSSLLAIFLLGCLSKIDLWESINLDRSKADIFLL